MELLLNYRSNGHVEEIQQFLNSRMVKGIRKEIPELDKLAAMLLKLGDLSEDCSEELSLGKEELVAELTKLTSIDFEWLFTEIRSRGMQIIKNEKIQRTKCPLFKSGLYDEAWSVKF